MENTPSRINRLPNKKPRARCRLVPLEFVVRDVLETSQTIQTFALGLGCLPDLDVKIILLKTPYTLVIGHREIKLILTRNLPSYG